MKILAIDYNSLMNRSFFAIRHLSSPDGTPTNALLGFAKTYQKLLNAFEPDVVVAAYDVHAPTFRHKMFDDYKGTRGPTADELLVQMPLGKEFVTLAGGTVIGIEGFEADDILGTLAAYADAHQGDICIIATGDRDSLQLASERVSINLASNKGDILYTPETVIEQYGVSPRQLIEVKSLMGDSSDNIPGVKGIGEKTALSLIQNHHSLQEILDNLESVSATPRIKKLIEEHREEAILSRKLGEITCDVPLPFDPKDLTGKGPDAPALAAFLTKYGLTSVLKAFHLDELPAADESATPSTTPSVTYTLTENPDIRETLKNLTEICFLVKADGETLVQIDIQIEEHTVVRFTENLEEVFRVLVESGLPKVTFDAKPVYHLALDRGTSLKNLQSDLKLAAYLLSNADKAYSLSDMRQNYLPHFGCSLPEEDWDAACLIQLNRAVTAIISERQMDFLYKEIELPLCEVLASMEHEGFMIDERSLIEFGEDLSAQIEQLKIDIIDLAGVPFNINSTQHLSDVLFNRLGLPPKKKTKTGYSTDAEVLESLRPLHPIIDKILEYRQLSKLYSTYVVGLKKCIRPDRRVHSTFNQTETRTGRISSLDPNVQNIPVRTPLGAEMRKFFVAKDGFTLVDADYSQIELRILAHISGDEHMIKGFQDGADIHRMTASQVFHVPFDEVPAELRSRSKAINFGIVYGISAFSLSQDIHVTVKEAKQYIEDYLSTYNGVANYMKESVEKAKTLGYVETMFHRPRALPDINSKKPALRGFSERVAMNMPIQGTAADIIKLAMIKVYRRLREENLRSRLILQVHDELIVEAAENEAEKVKEIVKHEMENAAKLSVKLEVDIHDGKNWYIAKG